MIWKVNQGKPSFFARKTLIAGVGAGLFAKKEGFESTSLTIMTAITILEDWSIQV
jgi:hypothetical protein